MNIYEPNLGAPKYREQSFTDLKGEIVSSAIMVGNFDTPLTSRDRSYRQKVNKETSALDKTLDQMDLTDLNRIVHPNAAEYTFFSSAYSQG